MTVTFVDTSFLLALVLKKDALHERARRCYSILQGDLITTEYVLTEFVDALARPSLRSIAIRTVSMLQSLPTIRIIAGSSDLWREGLTIFERRPDKKWSLTDCISFHVMERENVKDALTNDQDFVQAGFRALLREES